MNDDKLILPILITSLIKLFLKNDWENVFFELGSKGVNILLKKVEECKFTL